MPRPTTPPDLQLPAQALTASVHSVVIADARQPDLPIIYVNPAFERLSRYLAGEILRRNCRFLQRQDPNTVSRQALRQAVGQGYSTTILLRNFRGDGTPFDNELTLSPIRDAEGIVKHFVAFQSGEARKSGRYSDLWPAGRDHHRRARSLLSMAASTICANC
ncbi:PAS domain-containing protein [Deinococcus radiopugnans]|uniref:PAS domain S-box-containing protein n=1 Tax=Deinococcus radiopugnans ATCC 19172 TaxID=585398 RepID=A0A5C4XZX2_9DEIO|nr:PAS domain-containing protein [Deinococcus radiopugnans]MBB6018178.1 PAS domain S-box-containing protein [Deinococcus radiopugnans ATCC 19172]TNM68148.1 PAS domain-containing protein [Deinococcus radiopugnans ATCC 19172]